MRYWKLVFCSLLISANSVYAEHHFYSWLRFTLGMPAGRKYRFDAEFNYRRQSGLNNQNPFAHPSLFAFRTWFFLRVNEKVFVMLSPFAYFLNHPTIRRMGDELRKPGKEYRFSAFVEMQQPLIGKLFTIYRFWGEYRLFENEPRHVVRLRFRMGLRYDFSRKASLQLFDEVFSNVSDFNKINSFDHNRVFLQFTYTPHPTWRFEMGYIFITRMPRNSIKTFPESNIVFNAAYFIPFKKK